MIPLWLAIPCIIICLTIIIHWLLTLNINYEEAFRNAKEIIVNMIIIACFIIAGLSIVQWFMTGIS